MGQKLRKPTRGVRGTNAARGTKPLKRKPAESRRKKMSTASALIGAKTYPPVSKHRWKGGPYAPPSVSAGNKLHCEMLGDVIVEAMTKAPIPWPAVTHRRQLIPILCGDLVRAVCEEEELAIAFYWGVSKYVVNKWREALAGCEGSSLVHTVLAVKRRDPEFRKKWGYPD